MLNLFLHDPRPVKIQSTKPETLCSIAIIDSNGYAYPGIWQVLQRRCSLKTKQKKSAS